MKNGREETPLNRRRQTGAVRVRIPEGQNSLICDNESKSTVRVKKRANKKTSFEVFKTGREETRTLTPKAPVPKTGASTIPPLVLVFKITQKFFSVNSATLFRFQRIYSKGKSKKFLFYLSLRH